MSERLRNEIIQEINDAWLNISIRNDEIIRPLDLIKTDDPNDFYMKLTYLMTRPEYFSFLCKNILNIDILPFQAVILAELWKRKFPMIVASRGAGKSFILSLYCIMRCLLIPNRKIVVVGAAFRQSKILYEYMENIWKNAPILRDICDQSSGPRKDVDVCRMTINGGIISCLPIGDGSKIRGYRANDIIADEFSAQSKPIFETVIAGFAAVSASPALNVQAAAAKQKAKELNFELETGMIVEESLGNQIVISGTAFYDFNHFAEYFKRWNVIIKSKGDPHKLVEVFGDEPMPEEFNWRDYSIMRIPVEMLPRGFMDEAQVARSRATIHNGIFEMEYGAIFTKDSQGFFRRSLIESCVGTEDKPINLPSGPVFFDPQLRGSPNLRYVMGVDPASEVDNFAICIVEIHPDHRRIVYCWAVNKKEHIDKVARGLTTENNFYSYCTRKIRDLMKLFPISRISMDSQGGGVAIRESLCDNNQLQAGEMPIWEIIDEDKPKETDDKAGLHILEMCNFAKQEWLAGANHGLRQDFEDKLLLFPRFDPVTIGLSIEEDAALKRTYDTLEDCVLEIEELKNELSFVEMTQTPAGRDKWETPELKLTANKKTRMRKDRYSALLMANAGAKLVAAYVPRGTYTGYGGFAEVVDNKPKFVEYTGPDWFIQAIKGVY